MSYNITSFKVRVLDHLAVRLEDASDLPEVGVYMDTKDTTHVRFSGVSEGFELIGRQSNDWVFVENLMTYGGFSGETWAPICEMLRNSTGKLEALVVWEGGDSVEYLTCVDGKLHIEEL